MKRYAGLIILLIGLLCILFLIAPYAHLPSSNPPTSTPSSSAVEMTVAQIQNSTDTYTVSAEYPQFGIPSIDPQIKAAVETAVSQFEALPANPPDSATPQNQFTGSFDNIYVDPDVVSVELILYQYTGGAHGLTVFSGLNFDRATGKMLTLDDALAMTGLTLQQLSIQASSQLAVKLGDAFQFPEGVSADPQNFNSFLVSGGQITFLLQEYQVAAYSEGPQEVTFDRVK